MMHYDNHFKVQLFGSHGLCCDCCWQWW